MFCPNCGNNVPDGVAFCNICGTAFNAPQNAAPQAAPPQYAAPVMPPQYAAPVMPPQAMPQPPKKKKTGLIIGIVVAVIAIIVGALAISGVFSPKTEEEQIQEISEETAKKIERGKIDGNTYKAKSIDITFEKPENWSFATDEELAKMIGESADIYDEENFEEKVVQASLVYDMVAQSPSGEMAAVYFVNTHGSNELDSNDSYKEMQKELIDQFSEQLNLEGESSEVIDETFCGNKCKSFVLTFGGIVKMKLIVNNNSKTDVATAILIMTTSYGTSVETIEAMFK